jgi:SAM-dependent methyltransferase
MRETSKCREMREQRGDFQKYLRGSGLDVGAGNDPLAVPDGSVRGYDWKDGNGQLLNGVEYASLDFLYSSHALEHMASVEVALSNWARVIRPGGFLYVVVPDFELYEKCVWPSRYNSEHRHSFSLTISRDQVKRDQARENHWHVGSDLAPLLAQLGIALVRAELEDQGYDRQALPKDQTLGAALAQVCVVGEKAR